MVLLSCICTRSSICSNKKTGKLPAQTKTYEYDLEYGADQLEVHVDAIYEGAKVAIVDDLLATGGTVSAVIKLIESLGGIVSMNFWLNLKN